MLRHSDTQTQRCSDTAILRHSDAQTQRHSDTATLRHSDTQTQRYSDTATLRHSDAQTQRHSDAITPRQDQCKCRRDIVSETTVWSVQPTIASITRCHCFLEVGSMGFRLLHFLRNQERSILGPHLLSPQRHTSSLYPVGQHTVWVCGSLSTQLYHTVVASLRAPCGAFPLPPFAPLRHAATQQL